MSIESSDSQIPAVKSTVMLNVNALARSGGEPALVVLSGWEIGRELPVPPGRLLIGRSPNCDVVIPSNSVSREHAVVERTEESGKTVVHVSDLGSSNGTQVNGVPVVKMRLNPNDKIRLGEVVFRYIESDGEERRYHEEVHRRIHQHQLTGLLTRDSFRERLEAMLAGSRPDTVHCLAMTDLDGLKAVNDTHGHEAGSAVIRAMGEMFQQSLRPDDFAGIYGGDECMVCFPFTPLSEAVRTMECLRTAIEQHRFTHGDHLLRVTMSTGIAAWPRHGEAMTDLIKSADVALYEAKRAGRNRVMVAGKTPI
jgi:two-component system cell cycle response regulator